MSLLFKAYSAIRPYLFSLDAEEAHHKILNRLAQAHDLGLTRCLPTTPIAPTKLMGLTVRNPVGLAAGLDKNGAYIDALSSLGFGFIEVGTVTPLPQPGNPTPRLFRLPEAQAIINRMGFNNEGLDTFLANVQRSVFRQRGGILGLNIGKNASTPIENATEDYKKGLQAVYPHADYITINISSPNTANLRALQGGDELRELLQSLSTEREQLKNQHQRHVPIALKIAPDMDKEQLAWIVDAVLSFNIEGLITCNTTLDKSSVSHLTHGNETGGLSGMPVHNKTLAIIHQARELAGPDLSIIGVGGILQGSDARHYIQAGANAVQLYTGLIYQGPQLIHDCCQSLSV